MSALALALIRVRRRRRWPLDRFLLMAWWMALVLAQLGFSVTQVVAGREVAFFVPMAIIDVLLYGCYRRLWRFAHRQLEHDLPVPRVHPIEWLSVSGMTLVLATQIFV